MNKDQWYNVLEFSRTVHADLSNYDEDGACKYMFSYENKNFKLLNETMHLCSITIKDLNLTITSFNYVVCGKCGEAGLEDRQRT